MVGTDEECTRMGMARGLGMGKKEGAARVPLPVHFTVGPAAAAAAILVAQTLDAAA
jgi:hypothetical protein